MALDHRKIASDWLSALTAAISGEDVTSVAQLFLPDGWLRDFLVFTWDTRKSLEGRAKLAAYLANSLPAAQITDVRLNETTNFAPRAAMVPSLEDTPAIELAFAFECRHGHGRAHARLLRDVEGSFKALSLLTELSDLRGHEELGTLPLRDDVTGIPGLDMQKEWADWVKEVETKPYVLIGACSAYYSLLSVGVLTDSVCGCISGGWPDRTAHGCPLQADEHPSPGH